MLDLGKMFAGGWGSRRDLMGKPHSLGKFSPIHSVYSDASKCGFGAIYDTNWLVGTFIHEDRLVLFARTRHHHDAPPPEVCRARINTEEMWALFTAASRWSQLWTGKSIIFVTNSATV